MNHFGYGAQIQMNLLERYTVLFFSAGTVPYLVVERVLIIKSRRILSCPRRHRSVSTYGIL
jgi:hypothetical protein